MKVRCSSPTCRAVIYTGTNGGAALLAELARRGWTFETQPGDERPSPYCRRCAETVDL